MTDSNHPKQTAREFLNERLGPGRRWDYMNNWCDRLKLVIWASARPWYCQQSPLGGPWSTVMLLCIKRAQRTRNYSELGEDLCRIIATAEGWQPDKDNDDDTETT